MICAGCSCVMTGPCIDDADPNRGECFVCKRAYVRKAPGWPWETISAPKPIGVEFDVYAPTEPPPPSGVPS